jgi:hypothetical protein
MRIKSCYAVPMRKRQLPSAAQLIEGGTRFCTFSEGGKLEPMENVGRCPTLMITPFQGWQARRPLRCLAAENSPATGR